MDKGLVFSEYLPVEQRPYARSVDHIIAIADGGAKLSRDNVAIAHYGCNSRHGGKVRWAKHKSYALGGESHVIVDVDPRTL